MRPSCCATPTTVRVLLEVLVAGERRRLALQRHLRVERAPAAAPGARALGVHERVELGLLREGHAALLGDLAGELDREPERVVQAERVVAGDLARGEQVVEQLGARGQRAAEALLLGADPLEDRLAPGDELGVAAAHRVEHDVDVLRQEPLLDARALPLLDRAAHQAAQHVAAVLVGGHDAVGDQERHRPGVVGQDAQGAVVGRLRQLAAERHQRQELIGVEDRVDALLHERHAVEAQTGVDVVRRQRRQGVETIPTRPLVVLHEHEVPVLQEALARAAGLLVGRAPLGAAVEVELGARAARPGRAGLPEVVLAPELHDPLARDPDRLPDADRLLVGAEAEFLVAAEDRDPDVLLGEAERAGGELEREPRRALLEVVADREVAEHLEEGQVARGRADDLDVDGAEGLLAGRQARRGRLLEAHEVRAQRLHPGRREQHGAIEGGRHERPAGQALVAAFLEEAEERVADLVRGHGAIVAHPSTASPRSRTAVWPGAAAATGSRSATASPRSVHGTAGER